MPTKQTQNLKLIQALIEGEESRDIGELNMEKIKRYVQKKPKQTAVKK